MKIKAAITHAQGVNFSLEEVEISEPTANEVLIKIVATGVCHTDAVARDVGMSPFPAILGHEGSGIVEKVGSSVTSLEKGDHVVISYAACGQCENCLSGHPSYCNRFMELNFGGKMEDGTHRLYQHNHGISTFFGQSSFGTFAIANERNLVKVDKEVDLALLGPLGCGIQTGSGAVLKALKPEFGTSIAIYGCGAVGLSAVMAAKIAGCKNIIAVDIHQNRLELAKELGATHALNSNELNIVEEIMSITNGGTHYAVEATGVPAVVNQSIEASRMLSKIASIGITPAMEINFPSLSLGKTLIGVIEGNTVPKLFITDLIDYYKKGLFPFDKLVKFYNFDEINEAFEDSKKGISIKPILIMQ
ncbi:NAD(P)-dependent alcohol dehydrogenase [Neobacillus sp. NPDC097160]|uniref:NAD(P)-dependent alcohol dehydrogenase n=1 Tax=Neobacillus sp. NPDC097160 TaxID=3364298 RepID=UPI00380391AF